MYTKKMPKPDPVFVTESTEGIDFYTLEEKNAISLFLYMNDGKLKVLLICLFFFLFCLKGIMLF